MQTPAHFLVLALCAAPAAAQVPCFSPNFGTNLHLTDETISPAQALGFTFTYQGIGYTSLQVCDNGYVTLGAIGGVADFTPSAATLVGDPFPRLCPLWIDLEPGVVGSGDVWFRAVPASGTTPAHAVITWDRVHEYQGTTPHSFQLVLVAGGSIVCHYDAGLAGAQALSNWLVGASPGNGATQHPVNFAALPLTTNTTTLHMVGAGPLPIAGQVHEWTVAGSGFGVAVEANCAAASAYGEGCIGRFASVYEWFRATPSIDLSHSAMRLQYTGTAYFVTSSPAAFLPPSATAVNLNLGDDAETTVALSGTFPYPGGTTTGLNVASNGHVSVASNGAADDYSPTAREFLDWPNAAWAVWRDFVPNAAGNVWFEQVGNAAVVTWNGVVGYAGLAAGTTPSTFQLQFHLATGHVDFVFLALDTVSVSAWAGGEGWVVGYSPGGASVDPGSTDLSTAVPGAIALFAGDTAPLGLSASAAPARGTTITLETTAIPAGAPFGAMLLGLVSFDPGLPLASLGMPGCFQYHDSIATVLYLPGGSTTHSWPLAVPNAPGVTMFAQSVVYAPGTALTPLGALASNGVGLRIGR